MKCNIVPKYTTATLISIFIYEQLNDYVRTHRELQLHFAVNLDSMEFFNVFPLTVLVFQPTNFAAVSVHPPCSHQCHFHMQQAAVFTRKAPKQTKLATSWGTYWSI